MSDIFRPVYRELTDAEKERIEAIKTKAGELLELIDTVGTARYISLSRTALEESIMWAVKQLTGEGFVPTKERP